MRILCPYHNDNSPSMKVYEHYSHCFVCGAHVKNEELGVKGVTTESQSTNIPSMVAYILSLPKKRIRGLDFHADSEGYYILWPDLQFYTRRNYTSSVRYTSPIGTRPLFLFKRGSHTSQLVVIEGEINALSIVNYCEPNVDICSPGSTTNFINYLKDYRDYKKIVLILDKDPAGAAYGLYTKEMLLKESKNVTLILKDKDYNDILQTEGVTNLRTAYKGDTT